MNKNKKYAVSLFWKKFWYKEHGKDTEWETALDIQIIDAKSSEEALGCAIWLSDFRIKYLLDCYATKEIKPS